MVERDFEELGRWLTARRHQRRAGAKTDTWLIMSKTRDDVLGEVRWYGSWRQYAFYPRGATVYNAECLRDIQAFLARKMEEWRIRKANK